MQYKFFTQHKKITASISAFIFSSALSSTTFVATSSANAWSNTQTSVSVFGGASNDDGYSIAIDSSGNIYTTGRFRDTVDFDPGAGVANLTSAGIDDVFVSKLNSSGNFAWAKRFGGTSIDDGYSIAIDSSGNVYTTGRFRGTVDFDPGDGTENLTAAGSSEVFISKLNSSGNFVWAKRLGGSFSDVGNSIAVDSSGNVYTAGTFTSTADFDPGDGTENLTSEGNSDVFVSKLDSSGNYVWAKRFGGTDYDEGFSITLDGSGNVYTTGLFRDTADFDPGDGTENLTVVGESDKSDVFVSKLNSSGNYVWAKRFGGLSSDSANSVAVDSSGNVYTTGYFSGTADFNPDISVTENLVSSGQSDVFISKLNSSGNYVWAKRFGGTDYESGSSVALDSSGNVYTTGYFNGPTDFDPDVAGVATLTSAGDADIFISKLNSSGNYVWAKRFGGLSSDEGYAIAVDSSGNVYTTGYFEGTVDFNPGAGVTNLASVGIADVFVSKLNSLGEATLSNDSDKSAEAARKAAAKAAEDAARRAKEQKELTELLSVIPSIAGLALSIGDLTNSLFLTKCVKGKTVKNVKKGAKCPKGYKKKK